MFNIDTRFPAFNTRIYRRYRKGYIGDIVKQKSVGRNRKKTFLKTDTLYQSLVEKQTYHQSIFIFYSSTIRHPVCAVHKYNYSNYGGARELPSVCDVFLYNCHRGFSKKLYLTVKSSIHLKPVQIFLAVAMTGHGYYWEYLNRFLLLLTSGLRCFVPAQCLGGAVPGRCRALTVPVNPTHHLARWGKIMSSPTPL